MERTQAIKIVKVLDALLDLAQVSKILDTFFKAFHNYTIKKADGMYYLHGSLKLGGTLSGRMSSSDPNLQQLPSTGTKYAKPVKECFVPPKGWLLMSSDYSSLEATIDALLTKDPNKLAVYIKGLNGHCFNTYTYWPEKFPDIDPDSVDSINSISDKYPKERQLSKAVSFALQYGGTYRTLVTNSGFPEKEAKLIIERYNTAYSISKQFTTDALKQAQTDGYVTCAFGLRLRTPILGKTLLGHKNTPYEAAAEGRTAGNALSQSYGLLNNRSTNEFLERVRNSHFKYDILPIAQIHDASYYLVRNDLHAVKFVNDNLPACMQWQELDPIKHDIVGLSGECDIHYPNWSHTLTLPNGATLDELRQITKTLV